VLLSLPLRTVAQTNWQIWLGILASCNSCEAVVRQAVLALHCSLMGRTAVRPGGWAAAGSLGLALAATCGFCPFLIWPLLVFTRAAPQSYSFPACLEEGRCLKKTETDLPHPNLSLWPGFSALCWMWSWLGDNNKLRHRNKKKLKISIASLKKWLMHLSWIMFPKTVCSTPNSQYLQLGHYFK
jgi:hypothetical protein